MVDNQRWPELAGEGVFTDHHPAYPSTIPLLQVWINSALGRWDESLMNLPWWQCLLGLGAAFYGQGRAAGAPPTVAIAFTYMLLSMPLLNTHVALAGYADLFLGACYAGAIMAFHNWSLSRAPGQAILAAAFALSCPLIKNEGLFWLLTFIPAVIVVRFPPKHSVTLLAAGMIAITLVILWLPTDTVIAGHSLGDLRLRFRPTALPGIATILWIHDNWHLFGYLLAALAVLGAVHLKSGNTQYRGIVTVLVGALVLYLFLFLFTRYNTGTERFTAVGRISLHLVPGLMFLCLLIWNDLASQAPGKRVAALLAGRDVN
jgi:hypothetical protein